MTDHGIEFQLPGFKAFRFEPNHENLLARFELVASGIDLGSQTVLESVRKERRVRRPGVYFWTLSNGGSRYRIYLGKTSSLDRRLKEYSLGFQPGSPNDFKLRAFQSFLVAIHLEGSLDLHFEPLETVLEAENPRDPLTALENRALKEFKPLLINHAKPSKESRNVLEAGFVNYFHSLFGGRLGS